MINLIKNFLARNSTTKEKPIGYNSFEEDSYDNETNENKYVDVTLSDNYNQTEDILAMDSKDIDLIDVISIKEEIDLKINEQVGRLDLDLLEKRAWDRIIKLEIKNNNINKIRKRLFGVIHLLKDGELSISLLSNISKEKYISSACLQPFCNATEIMLYVSFVLTANKRKLNEFVLTEIGDSTKKMNLYELIKDVPKETLESVLDDYRLYRNTIAHSYQSIPIEAAYSFIQRTYENIQRLELLITKS
jgi:hypothetical protein